MLLLLSASTASATWLEDQARRVISGSRSIAFDNTTLFTPDASGYYTTQYTRDFYYALSGTDAQVVPLLTHVEAMQVRCAGDGGVGDGGGALDFGVAALILALVCLVLCGCWRGSECVERWVQGLPL